MVNRWCRGNLGTALSKECLRDWLAVLKRAAGWTPGLYSGLPVQMPMVNIQEVWTGGGSIARVEVGGGRLIAFIDRRI